MAENSHKVLKKKRVREFFNKFLKDADILNIYTKKIEKRGIAGTSITFTI